MFNEFPVFFVLACLIAFSSLNVYGNPDSNRVELLIETNCKESTYNEFSDKEFAYSLYLGAECARNYLLNFEVPENSVKKTFNQMVIYKKYDLAVEFMSKNISKIKKKDVNSILVASYFYGMDIDLYRDVYSEHYDDYDLIKTQIEGHFNSKSK